jgi:hypothetical protein
VEELTNDDSTWTNPVPATPEDEATLSREYVPYLCNSYVYEKEGGRTEVYLLDSAGRPRVIPDNVLPNGRLVENKSGTVSTGERLQLANYLRYLSENGGSLQYNFFLSPVSDRCGPTPQFASMLKDASASYSVGVHYYDYDWWEELQ